jgi:hypothetical protein
MMMPKPRASLDVSEIAWWKSRHADWGLNMPTQTFRTSKSSSTAHVESKNRRPIPLGGNAAERPLHSRHSFM